MRGKYRPHHILEVVLLVIALAGFSESNSKANENSKYLNAVREFADNVLKYGRDTYGPKQTPLFVDGLNIHTHEPVKWISPKGDVFSATETEEWILSNFASQQTLLRTLDGLSKVTGDPKYRDAAIQAIKYAFENLRAPNGLFYWGHRVAYDAQADEVKLPLSTKHHILKVHYPYYELMWQVDPELTKKYIEAFWSAHILNWENLDFNRIALYSDPLEAPWNYEYKRKPTFFNSKISWAGGHFTTGTSLTYAGTMLYKLSGQEQPLVWSKRLIQRFADARHPKTGISPHFYNHAHGIIPNKNIKGQFVDPYTAVFPFHAFESMKKVQQMYCGENWLPHPWLSLLLVGDMLDEQGKEFTQSALEELTAWANASYRKRDNAFVPMLTDGTNIEGVVLDEGCGLGIKGDIATPFFAGPEYFWLYTTAYRLTGDKFMWQIARDIAIGNNLGDIGGVTGQRSEFNIDTDCSNVYSLLGFLELYSKTKRQEFLIMAQCIADNIVETKFHQGFFVLSKQHVYSRFDCLEPLALLHLVEILDAYESSAPRIWPTSAIFVPFYRYKEIGSDRWHIYKLTGSSEVPWSLQEAAHIGEINKIKSLINSGTHVDSWDDSSAMTALHRAAISGHKDIVELLIVKGAQIDYASSSAPYTSLHYAIQYGHKDVVELLLAHGADVNLKDDWGRGQTPLDIAIRKGNKEIAELLVDKGAKISSIYVAAQMGKQEQVKEFLERGGDVDKKSEAGKTLLFYAVEGNNKGIAELLLERGANVNVKSGNGQTPLDIAIRKGNKDIVKLLLDQGIDVNVKDKRGYTPLYYAIWNEDVNTVKAIVTKGADVNLTAGKDYPPIYYAIWSGDIDIVKLLVAKGAKFDVKFLNDQTAFHYAVSQGSKDIVEFLVSEGIDIPRLYLSACMGDLAGIKDLVEQGADINSKDELGWTPLYWAVCTGQKEVVEFLIARGADVQAKMNDSTTVIHQAVQAGAGELAELLISKGADVNAKAKNGNTPLHSAASAGNRAVVELLIAKGATVNAKDRNDWTPLHSATWPGHKDVVEFLIVKGADVNVKDKQGRTALWYANRRGHKEIAELLRKHGSKE